MSQQVLIFFSLFWFCSAFGANAKPVKVEDTKTSDKSQTESTRETLEKMRSESDELAEKTTAKIDEITEPLATTRAARASTQWNLQGGYSLLDTWVVSKYGFALGYNRSASSTYELEYMRGTLGFGKFGIDIGRINEQRLSALYRSFSDRNSFHFIMGLYYDHLTVGLGSDLLATVSGVPLSSVDLVTLSTLGLTWGFGNRWQTKSGFMWGVDWFVINVPVATLERDAPFLNVNAAPGEQNNVDDAMNTIRKTPMFTVLKLQLGLSF